MWRPFGVGYGWDPFYNGAWAWYPGFGYTWVSTYPWGWTPYRYGSWMFIPNFGWAWRPGTWNTWYTVPPVYNAPAVLSRAEASAAGDGGRRGAIAVRHPTVVVDSGAGVIRGPTPVWRRVHRRAAQSSGNAARLRLQLRQRRRQDHYSSSRHGHRRPGAPTDSRRALRHAPRTASTAMRPWRRMVRPAPRDAAAQCASASGCLLRRALRMRRRLQAADDSGGSRPPK